MCVYLPGCKNAFSRSQLIKILCCHQSISLSRSAQKSKLQASSNQKENIVEIHLRVNTKRYCIPVIQLL
jgi:hypothetical protein